MNKSHEYLAGHRVIRGESARDEKGKPIAGAVERIEPNFTVQLRSAMKFNTKQEAESEVRAVYRTHPSSFNPFNGLRLVPVK